LNIAGWEVLGALLLAALYLALPARWRQVSTFKALAINVAFAAACLTGLVALVTQVNGYTQARLGIGLTHLRAAGTAFGLVTVLGLCALLGLASLKRRRPVLTSNMIKLLLAYPAWAYVQHLLVMGVFMNLVADWLGMAAAVIVGGALFGLIHWGDRLFFLLTAAIGLLWAWSFLSYPNLLPLAFSHAILATAHCYWVKGEDKWARIFEGPSWRLRPDRRNATATACHRTRGYSGGREGGR
jgi:membrane protease YdiL (CAAX protease family)